MSACNALVDQAVELLRRATRELEPDSLEPDDMVRLIEAFAAAEKLAASGRTIAAPYAERSSLWRKAGHTSAAGWLADLAGIPFGRARATIETGTRLVQAPDDVDQAVRDGELSIEQTDEVTRATEADPDAAGDLLDAARNQPLTKLRDQSRRVRAATEDDQLGVYERQRRARRGSHSKTADGMIALHAEFTPDVGAAIVSRLEAETDRVFRQAHRDGRREPRAAYMADALANLITQGGKGHAVRSDVIVMVDHQALVRGHTDPGERCEVLGGGPIPIDVARDILSNAFLKAVVVDGVEIHKVKHFGKNPTAEQRTALTTTAYLRDGDVVCSRDGCDRRDIEWDHRHPRAAFGPTATGNLDPLCRGHHQEKTEADRRAGLLTGRAPP